MRNGVKMLKNNLKINSKNVFEMNITLISNFKSCLMLNYYKNGILHLFINESFMSIAIWSFGQV